MTQDRPQKLFQHVIEYDNINEFQLNHLTTRKGTGHEINSQNLSYVI